MPEIAYVLYDTAVFGTTANNEQVLFQVAQGADTTHTENFTNSRGAGQLPPAEKFTIKKVSVIVDVDLPTEGDVKAVYYASFLEIRIADFTWFKAPLALLANASAYGGIYTQATASQKNVTGLRGDGYELENPIVLNGGTAFRVRVVQGTALSAASKNIKVALEGLLSVPG